MTKPEKYQSKNIRLPQRLAQPWCAERVVKQLRIDMEQTYKRVANNPMLEGVADIIFRCDKSRELDEIRLFMMKEGLEWEVEKCG